MTFHLRSLWLVVGAAFLCANILCRTVSAQEGASSEGKLEQVSQQDPSEPESGDSVIYLQNAKGEPVPVLQNTTIEEYLRWLKEREGPQFYIPSLTLSGEADDPSAVLTAVVQVQLNRENEWVRVPLGFPEAVLRDSKYEGPGEASFDKYQRTTGYDWWLTGKGIHTLTLTLIAPIQTEIPARRLLLTLPPSAVSQLKLQVPFADLTVNPLEESLLKTRSVAANRTEIEVTGLPGRLRLQWQPVSGSLNVKPILESFSSQIVDFTRDSVQLTARQSVQALQGRFSQVQVKIPSGYQQVKLDVNGVPWPLPENVQNSSEPVTVDVGELTTGPVSLVWRLQRPLPAENTPLEIEGFSIANAKRQRGEVLLHGGAGYQIKTRAADHEFAFPVGPDEVINAQTKQLLKQHPNADTFAFWKDGFRLPITVHKVPPYFTVEPKLNLTATEDRFDLTGTFAVQVFRGAVRELQITWPQTPNAEWAVEVQPVPGLIEQTRSQQTPEGIVLNITLVKSESGDFQIPLQATRKINTKVKTHQISLPQVTASSVFPTQLKTTSESHLELKLQSNPPSALRSLPAPKGDPANTQVFRVSALETPLEIGLTIHDQELTTDLQVEVVPGEDRLALSQVFSGNVKYEHLDQIRLQIPATIADHQSLKFHLNEEVLLVPEWTGLDVGTYREVRLDLIPPLLGDFTIQVQVDLPVSPEVFAGVEQIAVPLVYLSDEEARLTKVTVDSNSEFQVALGRNGTGWKSVTLPESPEIAWESTETQTRIPLMFAPAKRTAQRQIRIRKALITTTFEKGGASRSRAQYQVEGDLGALTLTLPHTIALESFWWNQKPLQGTNFEVVDSATGTYRLKLSDLAENEDFAKTHWLTIDYHSTDPSSFRWSDPHVMASPQFGENAWIEQIVWRVTLPYGHHLFRRPQRFTSQYTWRRAGFFWSRQIRSAFTDLEDWIEAENGPDREKALLTGNTYVFTSFGSQPQLEIRSISLSTLIVLGAGIALLLGMLLVRIPTTRRLLTILTLAFLLAVVGLWFSDSVQLLIQPAVIGGFLALTTAVLDRFLRAPQPAAPIVTISPSSEIAPTAAFSPLLVHSDSGSEHDVISESDPDLTQHLASEKIHVKISAPEHHSPPESRSSHSGH